MDKYEDGGKKKGSAPIVTNDPNDPRLRAYRDSLNLHNIGSRMLNYEDNNPNLPSSDYFNFQDRLTKSLPVSSGYPSSAIKNTGWEPRNVGKTNQLGVWTYKKPVQPVVYQKPQQQDIHNPLDSRTITIPGTKNISIGNITPSDTGYKMLGRIPVYNPPVNGSGKVSGTEGNLVGMLGEDGKTFYPDYENTAGRSAPALNMDAITSYLKSKGVNNPNIVPNPKSTAHFDMGGIFYGQKKVYEEGGMYDMSDEEVQALISSGYKVKIVKQ